MATVKPNSTKPQKEVNVELIYYVLDEIRGELREIKKEYVTKTESAALKLQIEELRKDFEEMKKQKNLWTWLGPTLTAILTAVMTYIVIEFLRK